MSTSQILGYSGLIPFVIFLWLFQYPKGYSIIDPVQAFTFYSVVIFSFISGTLWRTNNLLNNRMSQIISIIFCMYAFGCLFLQPFSALLFLSFGYLLLLIAEFLLCTTKNESETKQYLKMRFTLTMIVSLLHGVVIVLL